LIKKIGGLYSKLLGRERATIAMRSFRRMVV
jgi:hypothetical protein